MLNPVNIHKLCCKSIISPSSLNYLFFYSIVVLDIKGSVSLILTGPLFKIGNAQFNGTLETFIWSMLNIYCRFSSFSFSLVLNSDNSCRFSCSNLEKPQLKIIIFQNYKHWYLIHSDKALKGTVVNWAKWIVTNLICEPCD